MSNSKAKKKKTAEEREIEIQSAVLFGKHVSKDKAIILYVTAMLCCAMPMLLGARLWDRIPEIVPTGLIGTNGEDDSLPRVMVAYGLPALMCLLNTICHGQLWFNQKRMTLPNTPVRVLGRWGFPIISSLFCSGMILEAVGEELTRPFATPCVLGLLLVILGAHMWDCPREARIALHFSFVERSPGTWQAVHRFAAWAWMAVGLLVLAITMFTSTSTPLTAAAVLLALAAPVLYGRLFASR